MGILEGIIVNFTTAMWVLPVIFLGMWLCTRSWAFYLIVLMGIAWMAFVVSGPVQDLWLNPGIATHIKVMSWTIPPIFFIVLNIGTIFFIQNMRVQKSG